MCEVPYISVVVPVYKAEKYIERCTRALFEQTLNNIEYIFIDDCGGDRSIPIVEELLLEYPARAKNVKIIRHTKNMGVSRSRQDGVDVATGDYIIHCDPDDWPSKDIYERLYNAVTENGAEMAICDFKEVNGTSCVEIMQKPSSLSGEAVLGDIVGYNENRLHGALWNKLIKASFFKEAKFPDGINYCEDVYTLMQILPKIENICYVPYSLYFYRKDNLNSITNTYLKRQMEADRILIKRVKQLWEEGIIKEGHYKSFSANVLARDFNTKVYSDSEFRGFYSPYRDFLKYNHQLHPLEKYFIGLSVRWKHGVALFSWTLIRRLYLMLKSFKRKIKF